MRSVEEELKTKKIDIDNIEVPEELEERLRLKLDAAKHGEIKKGSWFIKHKAMAAVLALLIFIGAYNYDVFAYYGKKILGYDEITFGSMKELNDMGMGQQINKSYTFKNGTEVILDGVMLDENKLVAMYRIKGDSEEKIENTNPVPIKGKFGTYCQSSGTGRISDDKKEMTWVMDFKAPKLFDRWLTFNITSSSNDISRGENGSIDFKLDMDKAVKRVVKSNINKSIETQGIKYNFSTLTATQMSVIVEGNVKVSSTEARKLATKPGRGLQVELVESYIKDGKMITESLPSTSSGMSTGISGINFKYEFDGLKSNIKNLVLNVVKTEDMKMIDKTIQVDSDTRDVRVVPESDELIIKNVRQESGNTIVTFDAAKDVAFGTALMINNTEAKLIVENSNLGKNKERIEKSFVFEGFGENMKLLFKTLSHESYINKQITVYEEK